MEISTRFSVTAIQILIFSFSSMAVADVDFKKLFSDRDGCFLVSDFKTGKTVVEYNAKRCQERFTPCSSFKIAAAVMAFEKGVLKSEKQVIKWDGVKRKRHELNQDQTPFSWMSESVKWVTDWIMPQLGERVIQRFLGDLEYGNQDFSGGLKSAWVTSSLKISAREQVAFLSRLWTNQLPVSDVTTEITKKIIFIKKLGKTSELYGKTGTGCLNGHACLDRPDKMIGWFVGALKSESNTYIFAANASDLKAQSRPAGPRLREMTVEALKKLDLVSE